MMPMSFRLPYRRFRAWRAPAGPMRAKRTFNRLAWSAAIAVGLTACVLPGTAVSTPEHDADYAPGRTAAGNYLAGYQAQMLHDTGVAADYLTAALADDPDNPHLLARTFLAVAADGRIGDAAKLAERLAKINDTPLADLVLIVSNVHEKDYGAAEKRIGSMKSDGINALIVPLLKAWTEVGLGNAKAATKALEPLKKRQGFVAMYDFHLALISDVTGHPDQARKAFEAATKDDTGMSLRLAELYGAFLERSGKTDEARKVYQTYMAQHPNSQLLDPALKSLHSTAKPVRQIANAADGIAEALFGIANALRQQRINDTALILGNLALYLKPDFPLTQFMIASIYEGEGQLERANTIYRGIDPKSAFAWSADMNVATNLDRLDRIDQATAMLRDLAKRRPESPDPLVALGDILRGHKRFAEAVEAYDGAIKRMGKLQPRDWSVLYARGISLERSKNWARAESDFKEALKLQPDQPYVLNYLGYSWIDQGVHLDRARKMIEKAVRLRPKDGYIVDSLGWMHYRLGEYPAATRELERAVELRPEDPVINDHLGDAYWRVGRRQEARFQWNRSLTLDPEPELITEIEKKLKNGLPPAKPIVKSPATPPALEKNIDQGNGI